MATCHECIHYDACNDLGDAGVCYLKLYSDCEHFKSENDYAIATKCRNCKEFVIREDGPNFCRKRRKWVDGDDYCSDNLMENALELIKSQRAENKELIEDNADLNETIVNLLEQIKNIKSEAIKEFAERLKKKTYPFPCAIGVENAVTIRTIDDVLKEMVGEK